MSNRYEITSLIEKDHLGEVFLATDVTLQRKVVYRKFQAGSKKKNKKKKILPASFGQYTGRLCALQHPNLLPIYDIDQNDEGCFMVTQFMEAESLVDRLLRGPLSQVGVHNMVTDLLDAFHSMHGVGVYHGALRSDSVKRLARVRGGHRYLMVDLGLEKISSMLTGRKDVTGDTVLTAPELLDGKGEADARSDLFALGQLCYICLAGGHPMSGSSPEECAELYRHGGMADLKDYVDGVQPDFADWIMALIESDPERRLASASDALAALQKITLNAPMPNVAGLTQAVAEVAAYVPTPISQAVTVFVPPEKSSVVDQFKTLPKNTRLMIGLGAAVLSLLLIIALSTVFRGDGAAASQAQVSSVSHDGPAFLHPVTMVHVLRDGEPYHVNLDSGDTLDWTLINGVPSSSKRLDHKDGTYITSVFTRGDYKEYPMPNAPLQFTANSDSFSPRGAMTDVERGLAEFGDGWDVMLRVPKKHSGPLLVTFYLLVDSCDFKIELKTPDAKEVVNFKVNYAEVGATPGVIKVPLEISEPTPGGFYSIKILSSSQDLTQEFGMGLNAIQVQRP